MNYPAASSGVSSKALTIRNIPNDLYKIIARMAQQNRRSIQQHVKNEDLTPCLYRVFTPIPSERFSQVHPWKMAWSKHHKNHIL